MIKPGDKLLSESEMIQQYQLGRLTIREALALLANEGLIEKHHGKGTYYKSRNVQKTALIFFKENQKGPQQEILFLI